MNDKRRKAVKTIAFELADIRDRLCSLEEEEQESIDNTPESLQDTERYSHAEECVEILADAQSDIDTIIDNLDEM